MQTQSKTRIIALLFAEGGRLIECRKVAPEAVPSPGASLELFERDTHARSTEHCTRACCREEAKVSHTVVALKATGAGWDGLSAAIDDRHWDEAKCTRHEWCNLFDSYTLASYLRLEPPFDEMPDEVILVEVTRT